MFPTYILSVHVFAVWYCGLALLLSGSCLESGVFFGGFVSWFCSLFTLSISRQPRGAIYLTMFKGFSMSWSEEHCLPCQLIGFNPTAFFLYASNSYAFHSVDCLSMLSASG